MTLQLHRPDSQGGLRSNPQSGRDWREGLKARRWRVAAMRNTEMNPTPTSLAVIFWAALGALTFVLLLLGYGSHFWR